MNRHGIQRLGRNLKRLVRLGHRLIRLRIFQYQSGHHFVRFHELGIKFYRLGSPFHGLAVEAIRAYQRQTHIRRSVLRVDSQRFLEKIFRVVVVEPLVQQPAPAHAVIRVSGRLRHRGAELDVGLLIIFQAPEAFGAHRRLARLRQRVVASLCFGAAAMLAQRLAIPWPRSRKRGRGGAPRRQRATSSTHKCRRRQRCRPNSRPRRSPLRPSPGHLSNSSWTRASSTSASVSCFL